MGRFPSKEDIMGNKSTGTQFEKEFADILAANWFWVHLFQDNKNGQPCDVIAARNGHTYLFDCKDCQGGSFPLKRMEENQYNAMRLFELTGNSRGQFAIRFRQSGIYLMDYWQLKALRDNGMKSIDRAGCQLYGMDFQAWLADRGNVDGWGGEDACHDWE